MKYIITISLLLFSFCSFGQTAPLIKDTTDLNNIKWVSGPATTTFKAPKCDAGYSWMPSISTSSLRIEANKCLPDSICKRLWLEFNKNLCGESGFASMGGGFSFSSNPIWVNDSVGCVTTEKYEKLVGRKWVEISKCEYYFNVKDECGVGGVNESFKKVPCCGHYHSPTDWRVIVDHVDKVETTCLPQTFTKAQKK